MAKKNNRTRRVAFFFPIEMTDDPIPGLLPMTDDVDLFRDAEENLKKSKEEEAAKERAALEENQEENERTKELRALPDPEPTEPERT